MMGYKLRLAALFCQVANTYVLGHHETSFDRRQILSGITSWLGRGGKVPEPANALPRREILKSDSLVADAKRVKIRYGPYKVPNVNTRSLAGERGMLYNYPDVDFPKPCETCTIVRQQAGLEYLDGRSANIDTGMWLHHMVQFTVGPNRWDPTCYGRISLPHLAIGSSPSRAERYFSSGNERSIVPLDILGNGTRAGYHITSADSFAALIDLMNMNQEDKIVYMTMIYDFVEGPLPPGWKDTKTIWLDIRQCGTSEAHPPSQTGAFTLASRPWTPNFEGSILGVSGHLHDGGTNVKIMTETNKMICDSLAAYGETPAFISGPASHGDAHMQPVSATEHISSMTRCEATAWTTKGTTTGLIPGALHSNQTWILEAQYNYEKHPGMLDDGQQSSVMGIALLFIAVPPNVRPIMQ